MTDSKKLDLILEKVNALDGRMDAFDERMDAFGERMDAFGERMDAFDEKMNAFETDLHEVKQHVDNVDLIGNEIRVNIQRIAKGHLDLSRLLFDAARSGNEVITLSLRVSMLESDVRMLKEKVS